MLTRTSAAAAAESDAESAHENWRPTLRFQVLIGIALVAGAVAAPWATQQAEVAFVNVNVPPLDSERVVSGQTVIVRNGRIARVGPNADVRPGAGATVVDGTGRFLMPGVAEMHGHYPNPAERQFTEDVLFLYIANGVTLVRGMQGGPTHLPLRASIASGDTLGPRLFVCAPSMTGNSVKSAAEAERMVREARSRKDTARIWCCSMPTRSRT
jgi:hypothetical protein